MKLLKFQVTDFRSVQDSGWVDVGGVTSLIGTNESGKTNLLVPLWKLNPAKDGAINDIADFPRSRYQEFRSMEKKPIFIRAHFSVEDELANKISGMAGVTPDQLKEVKVSRDFAGKFYLDLPGLNGTRGFARTTAEWKITSAKNQINTTKTAETDAVFLQRLHTACDAAKAALGTAESVTNKELDAAATAIQTGLTAEDLADPLGKFITQASEGLKTLSSNLQTDVGQVKGVWDAIKAAMPKFVYYSNYGNLDSEIHLGRVIEDMKRTDLGPKAEARIRTLKVLFEFVGLSAEEIQELGDNPETPAAGFTDEELSAFAERKKERTILLKSASSKLTKEFKEWWQQGEYVFDLQADGDFFKVWVSDTLRPEPIELEGRSTGLQWFLSFFLIFLVESKDAHANTVILLDEPGLSLHPIAQKDLFRFFERLADNNQLLYTTHSPFLVDPDHLDYVRAVYVAEDGATAISADLRAGVNPKQTANSIYPVHAALGLSVSETLFQGCQPVIVEGVSDQLYLSAVKTLLIRKKKIAPKRELLFVPSGGAKGATTAASILMGKDEELPFVLLDDDSVGKSAATSLKSGLYQKSAKRVLNIGELLSMPGAEIEDLMPGQMIAERVTRILPRSDAADFDATWDKSKPLVPQVKDYAEKNGLDLPEGWKVQLATDVKQRLLSKAEDFLKEEDIVKGWTSFFGAFVD